MMSWVPAWATRRTEVPFKRTGIKSSIRPAVLVSEIGRASCRERV